MGCPCVNEPIIPGGLLHRFYMCILPIVVYTINNYEFIPTADVMYVHEYTVCAMFWFSRRVIFHN